MNINKILYPILLLLVVLSSCDYEMCIRDRAYGATINGANTVYVYKKSQAWVPSRLSDISSGTDVWAVALNGDNQWLCSVCLLYTS